MCIKAKQEFWAAEHGGIVGMFEAVNKFREKLGSKSFISADPGVGLGGRELEHFISVYYYKSFCNIRHTGLIDENTKDTSWMNLYIPKKDRNG